MAYIANSGEGGVMEGNVPNSSLYWWRRDDGRKGSHQWPILVKEGWWMLRFPAVAYIVEGGIIGGKATISGLYWLRRDGGRKGSQQSPILPILVKEG